MNPVLLFMLSIFHSFSYNKRNENDILSKAKETNRRDEILVRISPYLIVLMSFILLVLALYLLVNHGASITGTEANAYQRMELII